MKKHSIVHPFVFSAAILLFVFLFEVVIHHLLAYWHVPIAIAMYADALALALLLAPVLYALSLRPLIEAEKNLALQADKGKVETELLESEKRYRTLAESAEDAIFIIDREERLQYLNRFGASWFNLPAQNVLGKSIADLFRESYPAMKKNLETVFHSKKPLLVEEELAFPAGRLWLSVRLIPGTDEKGDVEQVMGIARNITEHKKAEAQRRLQSEALAATSNAIMISGADGTIEWVNDAFVHMTGYAFQEAVGKNPRILKSGEQPHEVYTELWATVLSGNTWAGELINRRKDGRLYFEKQTITPVKNDDGAITHFVSVKQDISADKRLEAQFRQAQKMEAVGRLAGGVAHDFNNLLTIILGHSDMMLKDLPADASIRHPLMEIHQAGERAAGLTRQLLAFSRKQIFKMQPMDLNEIARGSAKMLRRLLGEDIEFVTLLGQNLKSVKVDPGQMEQILMNLAVNSRDAMPHGGKFIIETSQATVDAPRAALYPGLVPGEYLLLKVQDTGSGISPEAQAHLFEPFFTTKEKGKGTGLGLATIYGIVKQSKGFVYAESRPGEGTAFMIYLPPCEESPVHGTGSRAPLPLPSGSETILIAEDEELVRSLAVQMLTRQGFQALEAHNGLEALRIAEAHQPGGPIHLLITDIVMPFMGGTELAEKFSRQYPDTKIIFTSGYTDNRSVQKWLDRGCRFLQKPYTHADFLLTVGEVLNK